MSGRYTDAISKYEILGTYFGRGRLDILCRTPTPYQPKTGLNGGYAAYQIKEDAYNVKFEGNLDTSHQTTKKHVYRRAKEEVCIQNGYGDFKITDEPPDVISQIAHATIQRIK